MVLNNLVATAALRHGSWLRDWAPMLVDELYQKFVALGESGLMPGDLLTLAAAIKEYQPGVILELGRGFGTSTALFRLLEIPVISVCRETLWQDRTLAALAFVRPIDWERGVNAIVGEIAEQDYPRLLADAVRPMIFWDAHGYDVAEIVFNRIIPALSGRAALVACHDLRDSRFFDADDRPPQQAPLWRGNSVDRFLRLGDIHSGFEQLVSIVDFVSWKGLAIHSPTHEIMTSREALALLPSVTGWPYCLWHYFFVPAD